MGNPRLGIVIIAQIRSGLQDPILPRGEVSPYDGLGVSTAAAQVLRIVDWMER